MIKSATSAAWLHSLRGHQDRGTSKVVRSDLSKTASSLNLYRWSTSARKLHDIRTRKKKKKWGTQIHDSHQCIHFNFLEEMEDKQGGTIMICGDFNALSRLWDRQGTNQQGCALDVLFTSVSRASATHLGASQGGTGSAIDLALVSPRLSPWTRTETLASHGSEHLTISLQSTETREWA